MADPQTEKELHAAFDVTLVLKGVHALIEMVSGCALYVASPARITGVMNFFVAGELSEDPHDVVANYLLSLSRELGGSSKYFTAFYLVSHGIVNALVVIGLWQEMIWAYPVSIAVLAVFIAYQLYLLSFGFSWWLIGLTVLDFVIIFLVWHEYRVLKRKRPA